MSSFKSACLREKVCVVCVYTCACVFMHTYLLFICEVKLVLSIFCNFLLQFWDRASHWSWNSLILLVSKARDLLASILPALGFQCELVSAATLVPGVGTQGLLFGPEVIFIFGAMSHFLALSLFTYYLINMNILSLEINMTIFISPTYFSLTVPR